MRTRVLAASAVLGTLLLAGCGTSTAPGSAYNGSAETAMSSAASSARSATSSGAMPPAMLAVKKTKIGYVLTDELGYTVYWFARDPRGSSHPACAGQCVLTWFPVAGQAVAAKGVTLDAKLGCITRANGVMQATYNGYPLYTFASDRTPGMTSGNGSGGLWHVIKEQAPGSSSSGMSGSGW